MNLIKRRHFLQGAGAILTSLGCNQLAFQQYSLNYARVLAQNTLRKRALLVGINDYVAIQEGSGWVALRGAITDVEMQRELLMHRFGFQSSNIRLLTNQEATRRNILREFEDLIQWAKPGDVVVVHYSGHGSTVNDPDRVFDDHLNGTLVPWDSDLPPGGGSVDDITSGTLFLLMSALKTDNVTVVLDSCHSGGGVRGNLVIRARPGQSELLLRGETEIKLTASQAEQEYQQRWLSELRLSRTDWIRQRRAGLAKGVAMLAAKRDQEAADATFAGETHAGVFTYALTRYLWQQTRNAAVSTVLTATKAKTEQLLSTLDGQFHIQTPEFQAKSNDSNQQPTYFLSSFTPQQKQAAEGVVTQVLGNKVQVLLSGVEPQVLESFGKGASLKLIDTQGQEQGTIEITGERSGLMVQGRVTLKPGATIAPGALLQEQTRSIPPDWTLRIGLDPSLENEAELAERELPKIQARLEPVPLLKQEVHYILGRMTKPVHEALRQRKAEVIPEIGSLGLFYSGLEPLPDSFGKPGELLTEAFEKRLQPKFKFLLVGRLLKLMLNPTSTRLKVKAAVKVDGVRNLVGEVVAVRSGRQASPVTIEPSAEQVRVNEKIRVVVENNELQDLSCAVVFLSADGEVQPLPFTSVVPAGETIEIPGEPIQVTIQPPLGMAEVMVVFSTSSLTRGINQLQILSETRTDQPRNQAVVTIEALLDDLAGTRSSSQPQERLLSTEQMAALSVTFEIIQ